MKLVENWRAILLKAWSLRFIALAGLLEALGLILPEFSDLIPPKAFSIATILLATAAGIARLVAQPTIAAEAPKEPTP